MIDLEQETEFLKFISIHNKVYESNDQFSLRREIFNKNLETIKRLNSQNKKYKLDVNHFTDMSDEEFNSFNKLKTGSDLYLTESPLTLDQEMKLHDMNGLDWRDIGAVTRVKDQG